MFSKEYWTSTSSPTERKPRIQQATPISPDFGIVDGPAAKRVPLLKRGILGYAKLPSSFELRESISVVSGKSSYTEDELYEIFALSLVRMILRLVAFGIRWAAIVYFSYASLIWTVFGN